MHLEIVTPESKIFTGEAVSVQLPGTEGLFQVLNNHAAIISTLDKGSVKIEFSTAQDVKKINKQLKLDATKKTATYEIGGGVVEMLNNKLIILAD
jgi:F-type H+-transporting ATPase subunit epsilon